MLTIWSFWESKAQVDISWKPLNQILAFGAPPALIERFLGCRHTFAKMKSGTYQLEWDVEDMIRKVVEDFCQQRKTSVDKLKKAISPTLSELDKPPQDPDSSQLKRTAGPIARVLYISQGQHARMSRTQFPVLQEGPLDGPNLASENLSG